MKIQRRSRFQPSSQGPGSSQAVKVPVPAKLSRSRFQPSSQGPGSSQAVKVPVPAKLSRSRFQPSSRGPGSSQAVKVPVPAKQRRSGSSEDPVKIQPSCSTLLFSYYIISYSWTRHGSLPSRPPSKIFCFWTRHGWLPSSSPLISPSGRPDTGSHIFTPVFSGAGGQRDQSGAQVKLRCLTRLENVPIRKTLG